MDLFRLADAALGHSLSQEQWSLLDAWVADDGELQAFVDSLSVAQLPLMAIWCYHLGEFKSLPPPIQRRVVA